MQSAWRWAAQAAFASLKHGSARPQLQYQALTRSFFALRSTLSESPRRVGLPRNKPELMGLIILSVAGCVNRMPPSTARGGFGMRLGI